MEAEFDLVCPVTGAACLESILETFVWEGCLRNVEVVGFVACCLLRSRADICLAIAVTELDIVYGWYRSLAGLKESEWVVQLFNSVSISDASWSHGSVSHDHSAQSGGNRRCAVVVVVKIGASVRALARYPVPQGPLLNYV